MRDKYLLSFHRDDLIAILSNVDSSKHFSININFIELSEYNLELAKNLLNEPETNLEEWDKSAFRTQLSLLKEVDKKFELKSNVHCRIFYLAHLALKGTFFPGNKDEGKFLQISGTVMRMTPAKVLEYQRSYVCVKCKVPTIVKADYKRKYMIKQPTQCKNTESCTGTNLIHFGDLDTDNCKDYQEIKIQEIQQGMGSVLNTMWVTLEDDLVDSCQPGDDVTICGTLKRRIGERSPGRRTDVDLVFKANHIQVDTNSSFLPISNPESENIFNTFWEKYEQNPLEGRDLILKSFCPQIYGLYPVKLAIATVLAGGSTIDDTFSTGVQTRSQSHLLLVGDPGTAKSQLLRFASKIIPRAVLTTGVGSTAAGLTVAASMEHGEWQLEPGALVMSDGGICCIDEFNSMKEHDRTTIHEAMEQQTISVAKAKMICKFNTRCSILAACNPKGNIDPSQTMSMNIALPSPLLSRFDLVMMIRDTVNQEWDNLVIDYILNGGTNVSKLTDFGIWPIKNMQAYFKRIKNFQPKLTEDAELILKTYYNIQRRMSVRNKARTTVRLLESLIRLSEGHARLMYHEKVQVVDSIYAIFLVDVAMDVETSVLNINTCLNTVFPERPKSVYRNLLESILNKLQLPEVLEKELNTLNATKERQIQSRFFANQKQDVDGDNKENSLINNINLLENLGTESGGGIQGSSSVCNSQRLVEEIDKSSTKNPNQLVNTDVDQIFEETTEDRIVGNVKIVKTNKATDQKINEPQTNPVKNQLGGFNNLQQINSEKDSFEKRSTKKRIISNSEDDTITKRQKMNETENLNPCHETTKNGVNKSAFKKKKSSLFESGFDELIFEDDSTRIDLTGQEVNLSKKVDSASKDIFSGFQIKSVDNCEKDIDLTGQEVNLSKKVDSASIKSVDNCEKDTTNGKILSNPEDGAVTEHQKSNDTYNASRVVVREGIKKFSFKKIPASAPSDPPKNASRIPLNTTEESSVKYGTNRRVSSNSENDSVQKRNEIDNFSSPNENKNLCKKKNIFESGFDESIFEDESTHIKEKTTFSNICNDKFGSITKKISSDTKISSGKSSRSSLSGNSVENDLKVLQLMPGVNDDFNIDLDVDWDSVGAVSAVSGKKRGKNNIFNSCEDVDFNI